MAHQLFEEDGQHSMMYFGEVPWHGLGQRPDQPATAAQAIKAGGLDWTVSKEPVFVEVKGARVEVPDRLATVRLRSNGELVPLGIVSNGYKVLQNREAFTFFDAIVGEGAAIYHTAGALDEGRRIWILAKLPGEIRVTNEDITEKFLLLSNSHDGSRAVRVMFTPIRVVCQNTLTMAEGRGDFISIRHSGDFHQRFESAAKMLGIINTRYAEIEQAFQFLVKNEISQQALVAYLNAVFPPPEEGAPKWVRDYSERARSGAAERFETGMGNNLKGVRGTLWAAYNGITEFVDHEKGPWTEKSMKSAWFGSGCEAKQKAFRIALEVAKC
jgi:phage/plasmid-like protein (TIGR03299 family)